MFGDALQARWGAWHLRAAVVTTASPPGSGGHASVLEQAAEGLREILEVVRALGRIADEAELLDLINMTVRVKLGCNVCAIAIKGDDGVFRYSATSGWTLRRTARFEAANSARQPSWHCGKPR